MRLWTTIGGAALVACAGTAWASGELTAPELLRAGGKAIATSTGHAAPFVCDWDGDGVRDLLVGQMGGGKLRIYRNRGTDTQPRFEDFEIFRAGGAEATVPSG